MTATGLRPAPRAEGALRRRLDPRRLLLVLALLVAWTAGGATAAHAAEFGIESFTTSVTDAAGEDDTRASGHPYAATTSFRFTTKPGVGSEAQYGDVPVEDPRHIITELPAGFVGNPQAAPTCGSAQMRLGKCPVDSQVGVASVRFSGTAGQEDKVGVYNLQPTPGHPAMFGFMAGGAGEVTLFPKVRSDGDYGLSIDVPYNQQYAVVSASLTFWGVPADDSHDAERITCYFGVFFCVPGTPTDAPLRTFLTAPATLCTDTPPVTTMRVDTWQNPGRFITAQAASPLLTGCDKLTFEPSATVAPTTTAADAPTGLDVDLAFPQEDNAEGLAPPALKRASVTLPEGMTISPSGADGLQACADDALRLRSREPVHCPDAAKVGTVTARTPLLAADEELTGGIYIRSQNSSDPESGEMFRLALVLENKERGLSIRLPGEIRVNKDTGRIETVFDNNPELPVSSIALRFKGGPRAPLATPPTCGRKAVDVTLSSWGGQTVSRQSAFDVECSPSLGGFSPGFTAGTTDPVVAASSPFVLRVERSDGDAVLDGLDVTLPPGLLAKIKGNLGTQVGTVGVAAGPGSNPYWLRGSAYLEGPYGDAPYSLRVVVPAKAGPFDLGDVVVRQKLYVDPDDAHVTVVSDPVPTVVKGVPVRLRTMNIAIDKPGFMVNPTSCERKDIGATLKASGGHTAAVSTRFQVGGCDDLDLKPQIGLSVSNPKAMTFGKNPPFTATVRQSGRQSNLRSVVVTMPPTLSLQSENARALCTPEQAAAKACPAASIVGSASAVTPLLDEPLRGNVYFVKGQRRLPSGKFTPTLPKLWVALRGSIALDLWADTAVPASKPPRLETTFARIPDAPISSFTLKINGGKRGILGVASSDRSVNLCKSVQVADVEITGHNGKRRDEKSWLSTPCAFKVRATSFGAAVVGLRVSGLGAGRLRVSGPGLRTSTRTIREATTTVALASARLNPEGRRLRAQGRSIRATVTFTPRRGKARTTTATVRPPARKSR